MRRCCRPPQLSKPASQGMLTLATTLLGSKGRPLPLLQPPIKARRPQLKAKKTKKPRCHRLSRPRRNVLRPQQTNAARSRMRALHVNQLLLPRCRSPLPSHQTSQISSQMPLFSGMKRLKLTVQCISSLQQRQSRGALATSFQRRMHSRRSSKNLQTQPIPLLYPRIPLHQIPRHAQRLLSIQDWFARQHTRSTSCAGVWRVLRGWCLFTQRISMTAILACCWARRRRSHRPRPQAQQPLSEMKGCTARGLQCFSGALTRWNGAPSSTPPQLIIAKKRVCLIPSGPSPCRASKPQENPRAKATLACMQL